MWPDRVSNPGPLALESDAIPTRTGLLNQAIYVACSTISKRATLKLGVECGNF